jgi:DNA polymerase-3 subunit beta
MSVPDGRMPRMKFTVERDALAEAVSWAARALPGRPVLPVLTGLLLSAGQHGAEPGFLTLSCFDYEVSARVRVPATVAEPGTVLVPGRLLVEIIRSLPPHPVEFADDPVGVSVSCGDAAFLLTPLPFADYPELPELPQLAGTVDGGALAAAIAQVTPAASKDDTLPMLTAVSVELDGPVMTLAATDRYRLAVRELPWQPAPGPDPVGPAPGPGSPARLAGPGPAGRGRLALLVPARTLSDAARMMSGGTEVRVVLRHAGSTGPGSAREAG